MKIYPIIQKIEFNNFKKKIPKNISPGDLVSVIYFDFEKEQIRLQQYTGYCTKFKSKGINTKLYVRNSFNSIISIEQQFFIYSFGVLNVIVLKKKAK